MKKNSLFFVVLLIPVLLLFPQCKSAKKEFQKIDKNNSMIDLMKFSLEFPKSEETRIALKKIDSMNQIGIAQFDTGIWYMEHYRALARKQLLEDRNRHRTQSENLAYFAQYNLYLAQMVTRPMSIFCIMLLGSSYKDSTIHEDTFRKRGMADWQGLQDLNAKAAGKRLELSHSRIKIEGKSAESTFSDIDTIIAINVSLYKESIEFIRKKMDSFKSEIKVE
jgi:hypothetical protein